MIEITSKENSKRKRYLLLAALSGIMGLLASIIFWAIYFFQSFTEPVPDIIRFKSAAIGTVMIFAVIFIFMYRRQIQAILEEAFGSK